jgi:hypothetical protein
MAVYLCSINDKKWHRGTVYCISVGRMGDLPRLEFLAPTKALVDGYLYHKQTEEWYTEGYRRLIGSSQRWPQVKKWLVELDVSADITLCCFCSEFKNGKSNFCHRQLVAKMITKWRPDIEVVLH